MSTDCACRSEYLSGSRALVTASGELDIRTCPQFQKAIAAAQDIVEKARQASEADHARMLAELRREVGRLVVATTAKVTGKVREGGTYTVSNGCTGTWTSRKV